MITATIATSLLLASSAMAAPFFGKRELAPYTDKIEIHESCNATERRQLTKALTDLYDLTNNAKNYVLANGPEDDVYKRYFGSGDYISVLGAYDGILQSNKQGVLLRCDNIDGNCGQEGWAGHWRGENATSETVICPLSYEIRRPLEQFCGFGYEVVTSSPSYYFATDLMHRLYHVPVISDEKVEHYADTYEECLELAVHNATLAPYNTHTLQYFAADVYGLEVGAPGVGCTGKIPELHEHTESSSTSASTPDATATSSAAYSIFSDVAGTATATAGKSCHTHDGGVLHCV